MGIPERRVDVRGECKTLYQQVDFWVRPLLREFGELEWGKNNCIISLEIVDQSEQDREDGWIVRKLGESNHYLVGIISFKTEEKTEPGFFVKTGGETVSSRDLTKEALEKALREAVEFGPTHLNPPGKVRK